jgi:hypothetical protein
MVLPLLVANTKDVGGTASKSPPDPGQDVSCPLPRGRNALARATSPEPATPPVTGAGHAHIDGVASYDGKPGIGSAMVVCLTVAQEASPNRALWLVSRLNSFSTLTHPLYFAKQDLAVRLGLQKITLHSQCDSAKNPASVNSKRTLMIVSADRRAADLLERNYEADQDCHSVCDNDRLRLPEGAVMISNQGDVLRTR